ncbi:MAG: argininosuccinate synthase [Gammaproteobacteria bacterium]|nr:argininosuccinate synthase [Gammaproteobacteria bacterium]
MSKEKIVLAYSGGLDTSVAIKWLQDQYHYDVIAMAADLGEGKDLQVIKEKALKVGAANCYVLDVKERFAKDYLTKALKANALYEGVYPLISALSRPLIADLLVDIAAKEGAIAVAHGCTGKGNDQVRFDVSINSLNPELKIVAPVRQSPMSREQAIQYAKIHAIPLPISQDNPFSIDLNLWGRSCECGVLEDPWLEPPEQAFAWTAPVSVAPDEAEYVVIDFAQGIAKSLNGQALPFHQLIAKLNQIAGKHGIGRVDHVENRLVGIKSREIYEAPAALTLIKAHQALESLCLTRNVIHFKTTIEQKFANMVYEGLWYSPLFGAINAFIDQTQKTVNGVVKMKLFKGSATVVGRQSQQSLYQLDLATYKEDDAFDHDAARGFIELWGLPLKVNSLVNRKEAG